MISNKAFEGRPNPSCLDGLAYASRNAACEVLIHATGKVCRGLVVGSFGQDFYLCERILTTSVHRQTFPKKLLFSGLERKTPGAKPFVAASLVGMGNLEGKNGRKWNKNSIISLRKSFFAL